MSHFAEQLPLHAVEAGVAGDEAQFLLSMWMRGEGLLEQSSDLTALSPKLTLFHAAANHDDVPELGFFGKNTLLARYYPDTVPGTHTSPNVRLQSTYKRMVAHGYHAAIGGEPWYDIINTGVLLPDTRGELTYERIVLPFRTRANWKRLICLTIERDFALQ